MTFVEYKMLNPFQRFAYNFKKFFKNIPSAIGRFFKACGRGIKKFIFGIGKGFKNLPIAEGIFLKNFLKL